MMELSKSFQKGQVPMVCQLCDESNEIKWKCIQCDFLLCTKCQKLHKKVKSTDQHTIIDINDIASHPQQPKDQLDFTSIPCGIHNRQNCLLFCKSCEEVVCPLCIIKIHTKHNMIELAEGYELCMKTMKTWNSEIDEKLAQNVKVSSELGILKSSEDSKYESRKQKILSREKDLKVELEKHTNKIMKEIDQRKGNLFKSIHDAENTSEKIKKDLDLQKKNISKVLNSNRVNEVFRIQLKKKTSLLQRIEPVNTMFKKLPKFVAGKQVIQDFYLGTLLETDDDQKQYKLKVIKEYKTVLPIVENLVCCDDSVMWICHFYSHKLHKMKMTNESLRQMHTIEIYTNGIALLPSGDLLLSTKEPNLRILDYKTSKVVPSNYSVKPLITLAVHVTSDHSIIVGAREDQPKPFHVNGPRQVIMMNIDGKKETVYQIDNKNKSIFTIPYKITTDSDNNIYVIDIAKEDGNSRIVALDKTKGVRWIYSGHPDITKEQIFQPRDLVTTKLNNILITDAVHHMIHILNTSGQCIYYLNTKDNLGIECPYSLDIDNRGTLYIGCSRYQYEPEEAKIYTVQVSAL